MALMDKSRSLYSGIYIASKDGWDGYKLTVDIKETEKSIILKVIDYQFRYSPAHIDMLFKTDFDHMSFDEQKNIKNGNYKAIIKKQGGEHSINHWSDGSFTLYPYRAGIPFSFIKQ